MGQGIRTALVQIVAQELSLPVTAVQAGELDTQFTPFDRGTNASSAVSVMGQAVLRAAIDARAQLSAAVARACEVAEETVQLRDGAIVMPGRRLELREAMRLCFGTSEGEVTGKGFFMVPASDDVPLGFRSAFWEIGIAGVELEIDDMTGEVRILNYVSLTDAGKMIHPLQCRGQDEGAVVFGMGLSLFEELVYEEGKPLNPNLVDYRLPRFRDVPRLLDTVILEEGGGPGPYGAKGLGEGGILAAAPALCNAVFDATGVRIRRVPLRGERVWKALSGNTQ
jgi:CO/xanthine dehydrogenase Mo-binding subunit